MTGVAAVVSDGKLMVRVLNSFTGPGLTAALFTAGTDITCDLLGDGLSRDTNENAVTIDRLCSKQVGESPGSTIESVELTYAWNPQDANTATAYGTLTPGSVKWLAIRYGLDHATAGASGQKIDIIKVVCGEQRRVPVARNEELRVVQKMFVAPGGTIRDLALTT